jgi:hypothetical protein
MSNLLTFRTVVASYLYRTCRPQPHNQQTWPATPGADRVQPALLRPQRVCNLAHSPHHKSSRGSGTRASGCFIVHDPRRAIAPSAG